MKFLFVHNILWSHYRAKVFSELYTVSKAAGIDMKVIQIALTEKQRSKIGNIDYSIHQYPYELLFEGAIEEISVLQRTNKLVKSVRAFKPNVLILSGYDDPSYWSLLLYAKSLGIKVIGPMESTYYDHPRVAWKEWIKSRFLNNCDLILCYGSMSKDYLKTLKVPEDKIHMQIQATDNEKIRAKYLELYPKRSELIAEKKLRPNNFLYIGRIDPEKNIKRLIESFSQLNSPEWGLIIVGHGSLFEEIKLQANGVEGVVMVGGVSWLEVVVYYTIASVFILPSTTEPWGFVVNEAMICNLPVLVSNVCGCSKDLVREGENGFTFPPQEVEVLAKKMSKFVQGNLDTKAMGKVSYDIIKEYTPEQAAHMTLSAVQKLL